MHKMTSSVKISFVITAVFCCIISIYGNGEITSPDIKPTTFEPHTDNPPTTTIPTTTTSTTPKSTPSPPTTPSTTATTKPTPATTTTLIPTNATVPTTSKPTPTSQPTIPTSGVPNVTTPIPATTAAPHKDRHFDGPSFIGGIILAVGLTAIGFVAFKFYKARTERNYHTL